MTAFSGELTRLCSTRLPLWTLFAAMLCEAADDLSLGRSVSTNATPPIPGRTPEGGGIVLRMAGYLPSPL